MTYYVNAVDGPRFRHLSDCSQHEAVMALMWYTNRPGTAGTKGARAWSF